MLFIEPGDVVYSGMIIGENAKPGDMEVNPIRAKEKTNIRCVARKVCAIKYDVSGPPSSLEPAL